MKTKIKPATVLCSELKWGMKMAAAFLLLTALAPQRLVSQSAVREPVIIDRGGHHATTQFISEHAGSDGGTVLKTNRYVTLGNGMNWWDDQTGQWKESTDKIELLADGAIARQGQHKVIFSPDITQGTELFTGDGKRLRSRILGLVLVDTESGARELTAPLRQSIGQVQGNQVIYPNALENIRADVRLSYRVSGFEQDIILREQPQLAGRGLRPEKTRLEVWTEFFSPPAPKVESTVVHLEADPRVRRTTAEPDVIDDSLNFDAMTIAEGNAFASEEGLLLGERTLVRVSKNWIKTAEGRTFLVESVSYPELLPLLKTLPVAAVNKGAKEQLWAGSTALAQPGKRRMQFATSLPDERLSLNRKGSLLFAANSAPTPGVVLDYIVVNSITNFTFRSDTTYYIKNPVTLSGTTTISGGSVIKYTNATAFVTLTFQGPIVCDTSVNQPAYFTAKDDNSVGETIAESTGTPTGFYGDAYLNLGFSAQTGGGMHLHDVVLRYCNVGIHMPQGREVTLDNAQVLYGDIGLFNKEVFKLRNVLFQKMVRVFTGQFTTAVTTAEHLTVHNCYALIHGTTLPDILLTNSLLISVTNNVRWSGAYVRTNLNDSGIFTNVVAGGHYLPATSSYRGLGTTNLSTNVLASIRSRTVNSPTVLTNLSDGQVLTPVIAPDTNSAVALGYHYPILDYVLSPIHLPTEKVIFTNGVSIGIDTGATNYGILLGASASVASEGAPQQTNRFVRLHSVQEKPLTNTQGSATFATVYTNAPGASLRLRFTELPLPAGDFYHLKDADNAGSLLSVEIKSSQLRGGIWKYSTQHTNQTCAFTNNLLEQAAIELRPSVASVAHFQNNTFFGGAATLVSTSGISWNFYDNIFDATAINQSGSGTISHNYNGYVTNATRLSPAASNDVVLTTSNAVYAVGSLGKYYLPATSPFINSGHTNANYLGLFHWTTATNETKEAQSVVDLGLHSVALSGQGAPVDADADGRPDFIEDVNGNGIWEPTEVSGLRWWLKADAGITKNGSDQISSWADQSSWGNNATQATDAAKPLLVTNFLNGLPVVQFDGVNDILEATTTPATNDFNILAVVRATAEHEIDAESDVGTGGNSGQKHFVGESRVSKQGNNGLASISMGTNGISVYEYQRADVGQSQIPAEAVYSGSLGSGFSLVGVTFVDRRPRIDLNGAKLRVGFQSVRPVVLAPAQVGGSPNYFVGEVAEILLYDETLSEAKRYLLGQYLNQKYGLVAASPSQPTNLLAYAVSPTQVSLLWRAASADTAEFVLERKLGSGGSYQVITNLTASVTSHLDDGLNPGQQYYYRVQARNLAGASAYSADANATTPSSGGAMPLADLRLWLKADAQVQRDATQKIDRWDDQSGFSNHARQLATNKQALWVDTQVNSRPIIRFDGTNDEMLLTFEAGENSFTLFAMASPVTSHQIDGERDAESGKNSQHYILGNPIHGAETPPLLDGDGRASAMLTIGTNGFSAYEGQYNSVGQLSAPALAVGSNTVGTGFSMFILDYQDRVPAIYHNGTLVRQGEASTRAQVYAPVKIGGATAVNLQPFEGDASEILVFNRSLLAEERDAVGGYLKHKYGLSGSAPSAPTNLTASASSSTAIVLHWRDLSTNESSFKLERKTGSGGTYAVLSTISSGLTNVLDSGVSSTVTYYYRIKACNYFGESAYAAQIAPPTIEITSPTNRTRFTTGSTNTLTVTVADNDGSVSQVEWFANATSLGTVGSSPFSLIWVPSTAGSFILKALATDNQDNTRLSALIHVTVDLDSDVDGLSDVEEMVLGTDPNDNDTDGDGLQDGVDPFPNYPSDPGDNTPPAIQLLEPADARQL